MLPFRELIMMHEVMLHPYEGLVIKVDFGEQIDYWSGASTAYGTSYLLALVVAYFIFRT